MDGMKRARAGAITSAVGIALNLLLAAAKITAGVIFGLVSVAADGFNNLSDCGSSAVALASFKISEKPADKEHPYGHRRAEYVASMIIGFFVLFVAAELLRESVLKIVEGTVFVGAYIVFIVLGVSIAVKAGMFFFYRIQAKRLRSDALRAAATDSACDCLATLAVIIGVVISRYACVPVDGWVSIAVALFILWQGIVILREAGSKLLGQAPDSELVNGIRTRLLQGAGVLGIHDLRVYGLGRDSYVATAHIEMDSSMPALESHAVLDALEQEISDMYGVILTAHLDPVDLSDAEARELESIVRKEVEGIAEGINLHDFRLVRGVKDKLIFEAGVPFSCPETDKDLLDKIASIVRNISDCEPVVTIERE